MDVDIPIPEVVKLTDDLKELTKNSVISVTVDDLNEGLIVVSYAHHDNLYQGVLLQLNRERGIPSGISFPKDYCTGSVVEAGGENNDPTQVPPLTQRHTYFQDKDGTLLNDPVKSRLALRRVIKPPARFKNSRMSLRLRHRPVLCAKCRTLCEEKFAASQSSSSTDKSNGSHATSNSNIKESNNSEDDSSKKQNSYVAPVGVSTRRSRSAECGGGTTSLVGTGTAEKEPEEDYSFVAMGTKSCVENYWKRPSLIVEENSKDSQQQQQPKKPGFKDLILKVPRTSSRIAERNSVDDTNKSGGSAAAVAPVETKELNLVLPKLPTLKAGKSKKSSPKSIKLCISKINSRHCDIKTETVAEEPLISGPAASAIPPDIEDAKMWENRIRKRSTVPLRFRDQGYVTKNIFNFKRRRDEGLEEEDEMPDLTVRLSPDEGDEPPALEGGPPNPPKLSKSSSSEISEEMSTTTTTTPTSSAASSQSESNQSGSKSNASSSSSEPAKTPVIKICFGTPGNGVVIQIPPKAKQEDSSASSSSSSNDKAARKALKKAKKEARRKLSLSRETSPTRSISPAVASASTPASSSTSLQPLNCDELLDPPLPPPLPSASSIVTESDEPIIVPNKKRKKEKKKKRDKEVKENGGGSLLSTNGCHSSNDSVENQRISPLIVTEKQVPLKEDNDEDNEVFPPCESKSIVSETVDDPPEDHVPTTRLCISLKRLNNENSIGWDISHNNNPSHPHQNNNNNHHHSHGNINELDELDQVASSPAHMEPGDFPATDDSLPNDQSSASSIDSYNDERRNHVYKKGDIVWGKLPGCPWWPGKILDILFVGADDVTARVSWYRASTLSCIRFAQLSPFAEQFEARYTRSRKRGSYQHAVRDALIEAHQLDPNDLPSD